jgi:hypothetical protein
MEIWRTRELNPHQPLSSTPSLTNDAKVMHRDSEGNVMEIMPAP